MDKIDISIIVPCYNCEKYLFNSIQSYISSFRTTKVEMILINDGSTDNTASICDKLAEQYSFIKVYHCNNRGVAESRNFGIRKAIGKYLVFFDADDYVEPLAIDEMFNYIKKYKVDMVQSGYYMEIRNLQEEIKVSKEYKTEIVQVLNNRNEIKEVMSLLWTNSLIYNIWNRLYKKEVLINHNIFFKALTHGEDLDFNMQYCKHIQSAIILPQCLYHYVRERADSATSKYIPNWFEIRLEEHQRIKNFFDEMDILTENKSIISKRFLTRVLGCVENVHNSSNLQNNKLKKQEIEKIVNNQEVQEAFQIKFEASIILKILLFPIKKKNIFLTNKMGWVIAFIRNLNPTFFNKMKFNR